MYLRMSQEASWGGAGMKILLSVEYERQPVGDEPGTDAWHKVHVGVTAQRPLVEL